MDAKPRVHVINGDIFYSPNCARDFALPDPGANTDLRMRLKLGGLAAEDLQQPQWWTPPGEWLGFVPRLPVFYTGALLEALSYIPRKMVFDERHGYSMPPHLINQWLSIDELLSKIMKKLTSVHPLSYWYPHAPYLFGYHRRHESQRTARHKAVQGRDWFSTRLGLLYWMICKIPDPNHREGINPPGWLISACQLGIGQAIIDSLRTGPLLHKQWITDRVGVVLPFPDTNNQPRVSWFISCGVPVWYKWGAREVDALRKHPDFPLKAPPEWQLQEATTWIARAPAYPPTFEDTQTSFELFSTETTFQPPDPPFNPLPAEPIEPIPFSPASPDPGALFNIPQSKSAQEILAEFFQKREEDNAKRLERETPKDRQRRENRERNLPTVSAPVYVWDYGVDWPNTFKRTLVRVDDHESTLEDFGSQQKRYDPFCNEWHCSLELGPDDPDDDDGGEFTVADGTCSTEITNLETMFLGTDTPARPHPPSDPLPSTSLCSLDIMRLFFGFVPPLPILDQVPGLSPLSELKEILGMAGPTSDSLPSGSVLDDLFIAFLRYFSQTKSIRPPSDYWDLHPSNRLFIGMSSRTRTLRIITTAANQSAYMFDFGEHSTVLWKLGTQSATVALLICRLPKHWDEKEIASYLLENGTPFRTLVEPKDLTFAPLERHMPAEPRFRIAKDHISEVDFDFYKRDAAALLQQRLGRAALLSGGLLWRIAKDFIGFDGVLEGPTARYRGNRPMFSATDSKGAEYVDDELTEDEMKLLCGLYIKFTGFGIQEAKVSWFPLTDTWEGGGLYQAWWSVKSEEWYTARVADIMCHKDSGSPISFKEWRNKVRGYKNTRNIRLQLEKWSSEELSALISSQ